MTRILAIDLGKFKSVSCLYRDETADAEFQTVPTTPSSIHDLLVEVEPDRVVIEVCGISGWIHDLAKVLELEIEVVDTRHEAWRWNKVKRKTDREDALKLARLSAMHQVSTVHVPERSVRHGPRFLLSHHRPPQRPDRRHDPVDWLGALVRCSSEPRLYADGAVRDEHAALQMEMTPRVS